MSSTVLQLNISTENLISNLYCQMDGSTANVMAIYFAHINMSRELEEDPE